MLAIIVVGLVHPLAVNASPTRYLAATDEGLQTVRVLLVLKAFSAGCSALTGVEAIANGVPLFKQPRQVRAKRTELLLGVILGNDAARPGGARAALAHRLRGATRRFSARSWATRSGGTGLTTWSSLSITLVLALAANTSFGGLPILGSLLARDNYVPHVFALRGDRQVFDYGIWALTVMSAALLIAVNGNTNRLIPLFAIGVFTGFTLSQTGLVVHWWRQKTGWMARRAAINGFGAIVTAVATIDLPATKFTEGAWVVVIAVPSFIFLFCGSTSTTCGSGSCSDSAPQPHKPQASGHG